MGEAVSEPERDSALPGSCRIVQVPICLLCLCGARGECHSPGCAFWMQPGLRGEALETLSAWQEANDE